ncbi:sensor histidine kinase [Spirobacillus cienkowskii]|uniref:sensor histidine kinase n=1 Tax=Spirobacillus cienkowskii TaxID=495820 RepID=UPI0030CCCE94
MSSNSHLANVKANLRPLISVFYPSTVKQRIFLGIIIGTFFCLLIVQFLPIFFVLPIFLIYCYFILYVLVDKPTQSLLQLTRHGGFDVGVDKVAIVGHDEFSRIARAVQDMAKRMRGSILEAREQTSRLDEIFAAIGEGVVIVNYQGKVLKINNTVRRWLGWYTDVADRDILEVLRSVELSELIKKMIQNVSHDHAIQPQIIESLHLDGPEIRRVRAKIVVLHSEQQNPVFMIFLFDLTDIHKGEEIRREFFANVSHELKTPISAIRGYAEIIQDMPALKDNDMAQNFLTVIVRNSENLTKLIDEMLIVTGLESGSLTLVIKPYQIHEGIRRVVENILPKAKQAGVEIQSDVDPEIEEIYVDAQRFDSVLVNLVDNAVKYNRPGGIVKISVRKNDTHHIVFLEDTGIGIPNHSRLRAFERFYRVDKSHNRLGGGSGLGLAIVKHIVQAHGGTITLRSEVGVGSVFTIMLPKEPSKKKIDLLTPF